MVRRSWPHCADNWDIVPTEKRPGKFVVSVGGGSLGDEGNKGNTRENTAFLEEMTEEVGGPSHLLSGPNVHVRQIPLSTRSSVTVHHIC